MNARSYRLVFSRRLGMWVPVSEIGVARVGKQRDRKAAARRMARTAAILVSLAAPVWAADPLPANTVPTGAVVRGGVIGIEQSGNTLNINQSSQNGIIHWNSFNIGSAATVNFNQPGVTSATLNRIVGNEASVIQGAMNATGAVYVINRNGILFDKGAQVNLHTLVASTLDIKDDALFRDGFLTLDGREAAFSDQYNSTGELNLGALAGTLGLAEGAHISSQGGRVILMAPDVTNAGKIETNGGQVIVAAGRKAYFHTPGSADSLLRGLVVTVEGGGGAVNLGDIAAGTGGDATLIGAIVKQNGNISAATSVNVNGTIHLLAQHRTYDLGLSESKDGDRLVADQTGQLEVGAGSHTAIMPALDNAKVKAAVDSGKLSQARVDAYRNGDRALPDLFEYLADDTVQAAQTFFPSKIVLRGKTIWIQENASLVAPAGEIDAFASGVFVVGTPFLTDDVAASFLLGNQGGQQFCPDCRIQVDDGAILDVAGLRDVPIAMERNVVEVELRGNELRDSPLLHGKENAYYEAAYGDATNPLYGQKIKVDIRNSATVDVNGESVTRRGTALADASGYIAQIGYKIDEKSAVGGSVNLRSEGGVVVGKGATVDVSGGSLRYLDGEVTTSQLLYQGRYYDIATAAPDKLYQGLGPDVTVFEQGYTEGKDAGALTVVAPAAVLQGSMMGGTVVGEYQRGGTGDALPKGGELVLGFNNTKGNPVQDYRLISAVSFGDPGADAPDFSTPLWRDVDGGRELVQALRTTVLDPETFNANGFNRLTVHTNNAIELPGGVSLNMDAGGAMTLVGAQIDIDGNISLPGGRVSMKTENTVYGDAREALGMEQRVLDGHLSVNAAIVTAGTWANDYLDRALRSGFRPVVLNGGAITLGARAADLRLGAGALLDTSGGAWLKSDGVTLAAGAGGDITLEQRLPVTGDVDHSLLFVLDGEMRGFGVLDSTGKASRGGKLTLRTARNIRIGGDTAAAADELLFAPDFLTRGGFTGYDLASVGGNLTVAEGTRVAPRASTLEVGEGGVFRSSGASIADFAVARGDLQRDSVAKRERPATSLALSASVDPGSARNNPVGGDLTVGVGASIELDSLAGLSLAAGHILDLEGDLSAPGGDITLRATGPIESRNVAIWLGKDAHVSASGIARIHRSANGRLQGAVVDGGDISLLTDGYILAEAGAVLETSGALGALDLPDPVTGLWTRSNLPSNGGAIRLAATEGIFLNADTVLTAAAGGAGAAAGTLSVELDRVVVSGDTANLYPHDTEGDLYPHVLTIQADAADKIPASLTAPGSKLADTDDASGVIHAGQLAGFSQVTLKAGDALAFSDSMDFVSTGSLVLDAPNLVLEGAAKVSIDAAYVNLGNGDPGNQARGAAASGGEGELSIHAGLLDLTGHMALIGVGTTTLNSDGDLRLIGAVDRNLAATGKFSVGGDLSIEAAQVYATTLSEFELVSDKPGGTIGIAGKYDADGGIIVPDVPLSGASRLTLRADNIEQGGVLRAPLGYIELDAADTLTLLAGSLTSVSAEGADIPFGRVENGATWVYDFTVLGSDGKKTVQTRTLYSGSEGIVDNAVLGAKEIHLAGTHVDLDSGATLDVSGGGDLVGYEFAAGPGGGANYLAQDGVFAILPDRDPSAAPVDYQANRTGYVSTNSDFVATGVSQTAKPGDRVYLSAIPELGIKAGYYTLLPAQYALLPGAYAVRAVANSQDRVASANVRKPDGAYLVAGYQTGMGSGEGGTRRWSGFEVAGRDVVATNLDFSFNVPADTLKNQVLTGRSEIIDYRMGRLIPAVNETYGLALPRLARDAGRLGIEATQTLTLAGDIKFDKVEGGLGGELDIASRYIAVTDGTAPHVDNPGDFLVLDVDLLDSFKVDSLMLGGIRRAVAGDASRLRVDQVADAVVVETSADKPLKAPEVMLVSKHAITLAANSVVLGANDVEGGVLGALGNETLVFGEDVEGGAGDGVLVRASSGVLRGVTRRNLSRQGDPSDGLFTADDALVRGEGSVNLDATYTAFNLGLVELGANGGLQLGATRIALGQVDQVREGVFVTNTLLESLGDPSAIVLKSYSNFDVYGEATLGSATTKNMTLDGAGFLGKLGKTAGEDGVERVVHASLDIHALGVTFANSDATVLDKTDADGAGTTLKVHANTIGFGQGGIATAGFGDVEMEARGEIAGLEGTGGLNASGNLTLTAQRIVGYNGGEMRFESAGKLTTALYRPATPGEAPLEPGDAPMGARMAFVGGTGIEHGGDIELPAGWLTLTATTGDLDLLADSTIFTGGVTRVFEGVSDSVQVYVAGGATTLNALDGDLTVEQSAVVDVGGRGGADAGRLDIHVASGNFRLDGELRGDVEARAASVADPTPAQPVSGVFSLDARTLGDGDPASGNPFSSLLAHMTGFNDGFDLRLREGDIDMAAGDRIQARRTLISADQGVVDIAGTIDSRHSSGGWVAIAAGRELHLRDGALIDASATGADQRGGEVYLISGMDRDYVAGGEANGALVLEAGSTIKVGGTLASTVEFAGNEAGDPDIVLTRVTGGRVHLQAPRLARGDGTTEVRITRKDLADADLYGAGDALAVDIEGAALVEVLGNQVFDYETLGGDEMAAIKDDTRSFMSNAAAISDRLNGGANTRVRASVEVRSAGDLTFTDDYDFGVITADSQDQPGTLTLRAAGDLIIAGNLSDGFDAATVRTSGAAKVRLSSGYKLDSGDSWAYRLVAGADLGAANPMRVRNDRALDKGDFKLLGGKMIRTGTGAIQIAAEGDVEIGLNEDGATYDANSVIYTAGRLDSNSPPYARTDTVNGYVNYGVDGGRLDISANGAIRAPEYGQLANNWLQRRNGDNAGTTTSPVIENTSWGVAYGYFTQGIGALGGGDVRVAAGGDIENLSVSLPTAGRDYAPFGADTRKLFETGGGNAEIIAQGDIRGGFLYVQKGEGRISSGGRIGAMPGVSGHTDANGSEQTPEQDAADNRNLILALGDANIAVNARDGLVLETVFNATMGSQSGNFSTNVSTIKNRSANSTPFFTYSSDSGVDLVTAQGDAVLSLDPDRVYNAAFINEVGTPYTTSLKESGEGVFPGTLTVAAPNGELGVDRAFRLYPASQGRLHLLARDDIALADGIFMTDEDPTRLYLAAPTVYGLSTVLHPVHAAVPVHLDDADPVRVYSELGSISGSRSGTGMILPKSVEFLAGQDLLDLSVYAQNLGEDHTSSFRAGRDIRYSSPRNGNGGLIGDGPGISVGGGGYIEVIAGRDIDLGTTGGIVATGNLDNPNLPYGSAGVFLLASMGTELDSEGRPRNRLPDYDAFLASLGEQDKQSYSDSLLDYERLRQALLDPANAALSYKEVLDKLEDPVYRQAMTDLAANEYARARLAFDDLLADPGAGAHDKAARLLFYNELRQAALEASLMKQLKTLGFDLDTLNQADQPGLLQNSLDTLAKAGLSASTLENYQRFFGRVASLVTANKAVHPDYDVAKDLGYDGRANKAAVALLPAPGQSGDIKGFYSQVRTEQGSDIDMLVPSGNVVVGLVNAESVEDRDASQTGLYTVNGGAVRSYSSGDFLVNTSRVFTLGWGETLARSPAQYLLRDDILLYSQEGDVDAGKGAKTASSAPPPSFTTDAKGFTRSDLGKSISGSGIGVLLVRDVLNRGDTYLIAPSGEVNAGDAGIRASGNLFIDANRVVGADNIVSVGVSVGVPVALDTGGLSVSGVGNIGEASKAAQDTTRSLASSGEEAQKAAQEMKQALASFRPSFITVEVLGFGDAAAGTDEDEEERRKKRRAGA